MASVHTQKMPLLEIFISMFLKEVDFIIKQGLRRAYVPRQENCPFLKGKLLMKQQIQKNFIHRERFFVEYDEFMLDRPENRIIKIALKALSFLSRSFENQKRIREFRFTLDEVGESRNLHADFSKCRDNRLMKHYQKALTWSRVFLMNESFTNYRGSTLAYALLFPMERIFEDYVGWYLKKHFSEDWQITFQGRNQGQSLATEGNGQNRFYLKPDFILENDHEIIILDAKWKRLDGSDNNYGISQGDFYQMFAYAKVFGKDNKKIKLGLIYPSTRDFHKEIDFYFNDENGNKGTQLQVLPFNLETARNPAL
jgi:5-methylcytosine-specific restriction enzyme subunit McrC